MIPKKEFHSGKWTCLTSFHKSNQKSSFFLYFLNDNKPIQNKQRRFQQVTELTEISPHNIYAKQSTKRISEYRI